MKKIKNMTYAIIAFCILLFGVLPANADLMDWSWFNYYCSQGSTPIDFSPSEGFCALTRISGKLQHNFDFIFVGEDKNDHQKYKILGKGGTDFNADIECSRFSNFKRYSGQHLLSTKPFARGNPIGSGDYRIVTKDTSFGNDSVCFLAGVGGKFDGRGEIAWIWDADPWNNNRLHVEAHAYKHETSGEAVCVALQPGQHQPIHSYGVSQGEPDVRMIHASEGVCFLSGMSGRFKGRGEEVGIYVDSQGYRTLYARSQQVDVAAKATCILFSE